MWEEDTEGRVRVYVGADIIDMNNGHNQLCAEYTTLIYDKGIMLINVQQKADTRYRGH